MAPVISPTAAGVLELTTAAGRVRSGGPVLHRRLCAIVTAASCAVHVWLAVSGHHGVWLGLVMLALAAVCVPCTVHIWRFGNVQRLHQVTAAALAMVVLHAVLLLGAGSGEHVHGGGPSAGATDTTAASHLLLVIALEVTTALLAATLVARRRRQLRLTCAAYGRSG